MPERSKRIYFYDDEKLKNINKDNLELLRKYKVDMTLRELSQTTIKAYENDIKEWFIYILDNQFNQDIIKLTEDDITEFLYYCKTKGNNVARMTRRMSSISAFYRFLRKKRLIIESPTEFLDRPKRGLPITVQTFLTREQVDMLRVKLIEYGNLQLQTYVLFSLSTMARVTAVSRIKWEMIDFDNRIVHNVLEKENKLVELYFSEEVKELLLKLKAERKKQHINDYGWVFYTNKSTIEKPISKSTLNEWAHIAGSLIGIDTIHPHDFRHSGATLLKNAGMPLEYVSALLSHSSTETTKKYYLKDDTRLISQLKDQYSF